MGYFVYIMASKRNGTLYIGVTNDLVRRSYEHCEGLAPGFTRTYSVTRLVWFEQHETALAAIAREKALKKWRRSWKLELIEAANPQWRDLFDDIAL